MNKTKITKQIVKKLIKQADFLNSTKKKDWNNLVDILDELQLKEVYDHLLGQIKLSEELKLKLITKHGFSDEHLENIEKLSRSFLKKANGI